MPFTVFRLNDMSQNNHNLAYSRSASSAAPIMPTQTLNLKPPSVVKATSTSETTSNYPTNLLQAYQARRENAVLDTRISTLKTSYESLVASNMKFKKFQQAQEKQTSNHETKIAEMERIFNKRITRLENIGGSIESVRTDVEEVKEKMKEVVGMVQDAQKALQDMEVENGALRNKVGLLEKEVDGERVEKERMESDLEERIMSLMGRIRVLETKRVAEQVQESVEEMLTMRQEGKFCPSGFRWHSNFISFFQVHMSFI
jgi:chromosome segregation ATPase